MIHFSKKLLFVLVSAAVVLTGCTKKPKRPSPDQTMLGPGPGGGINMSDVAAGDLGLDPGSSLEQRGNIDPNGQMRNVLEAVYFDFDKSAIKPSERPKVQEVKSYLDSNPQYRVLFEGHCDWKGTAEYNLGLGDRRAAAVRQYAESLGIPVSKIETLSKGDLDAIENADESQRAKDRRVEIVILTR